MDIEALIRRAQAGDARAFNHLVDTFQGLAFHVALHNVGNVTEQAEDACQEAMLSAWQAIGRFEGDGRAFRAWLLRIVVNACRDSMRRERRRPHDPIETERDGETRAMPLPDPGQSPEAYAELADLASLLTDALDRLSAEHREVILLDHAGFNYAEIAGILDVETGTVKSRLSRARAAMRDVLTGSSRRPDGRAELADGDRRSQQVSRSEPYPTTDREAPQAPSTAGL